MHFNINNYEHLKSALNIVWMISALTFLGIIIIVTIFPENLILSKIPICESKKNGLKCFLCGTTRAFYEIKNFNLVEANKYNEYSIQIFLFMAINFFAYFLKTQIKKLN